MNGNNIDQVETRRKYVRAFNSTKEYEVQTAALTSDDVRLPYGESAEFESDFYAMAPILITDFTSEISDGDESSTKSLG